MTKRDGNRVTRVLTILMCLMLISTMTAMAEAPLTLEEQLAPYNPPIVLSIGHSEGANVKYGDGESKTDNRWITKFKEDLGIDLQYAWIAPGDQYGEKVNIIIASGDLPDMMKVNSVQLAKCVENELVMTDLKPLFDKYVTETQLLDYQTLGTEQTFAAATYDGKLAAIPNTFSAPGQGVNTISLRRDWLAAVNAEVPKTFDELMDLFELWRTQDFDGNGKDDTFGFYANRSLDSLKNLAWCFGAYPNYWVNVDGQLVYGSAMPQMKDALVRFHEMYEKGYIDPEFAVKDGAKANELFTQNRIGATSELAQPGGANDLVKAVEGSEYDCYALPTATDQPVKTMMASFGNDFYAIRKDYEYPEAVIKMFCYMTELSYGKDATYDFYIEYNQNYDTGLAPFTWGPWFNISVEKNYRSYNKFKNNEDYNTMNPEEQWIYDTMVKYYEGGDANQWWMARFFDTNVGGHYLVLDETLASGNYLLDAFYGAPLQSIVEYKGIVDRLFEEMCVKIIMGDEPVDSFENYVAQMNQAGLETMTADVNAWYADQQAS